MSHKKSLASLSKALLVLVMVLLVTAPSAWAQGRFKLLHEFKEGEGGEFPLAGVIFDTAGNLYGTTYNGGASGDGIVFRLTPRSGGSWKANVLYSFCALTNCADGANPHGSLVFDAAGNLYGTTVQGGDLSACQPGCGVVFKLTPRQDGRWKEGVLRSFTGGSDGIFPEAGLISDKAGNLYGTTYGGGNAGAGTVFQLVPKPDGSWAETVLYSFCPLKSTCPDGAAPIAGLILDNEGNLYGTTSQGGSGGWHKQGWGAVFRLAPKGNGNWTESLLYSFCSLPYCRDGYEPASRVVFDQAGNLYGTTFRGGDPNCNGVGCGTVFELTPNADGSWKEKVLRSFEREDGWQPTADLILDGAGDLYGTTYNGGSLSHCSRIGCGVVFKLTPNLEGGWNETVLHYFADDAGGALPYTGLIFDTAGNLYGATRGDGTTTFGSVFEITP